MKSIVKGYVRISAGNRKRTMDMSENAENGSMCQ